MKLDLRFLNRPIEDLWCQAIVLFVFQDPSIAKGVFFNINDKMGGSLSDILNAGLWTGERGENFLLSTQAAIRADKLLMRGVGPPGSFGVDVLIKEASDTASVLDKMGIREFGINIPTTDNRKNKYGLYLEKAATNMVESFFKNHQNDPDFLLKIFFTFDDRFMKTVERVIKRLKENIRPGIEFSIMSDRQI